MNKTIKWLVTVASTSCLVFSMVSYANDSDIETAFSERSVLGTMVISSLNGKKEYVYNDARSNQRFVPASTFKIPNTLIALDTKVIADINEVIEWDGSDHGWSKWNKNQTLKSAFPLSCIWCYQELSKRVGNDEYLRQLRTIDYGNHQTGSDVTTFWLEGDLKISAREQIEFLKKVYSKSLPYSKEHISLLTDLMIEKNDDDYILRAKTGWAMTVFPQVGWYVGYIETKSDVWFFAMNMEIMETKQSAFRKEIAQQALKSKGIL